MTISKGSKTTTIPAGSTATRSGLDKGSTPLVTGLTDKTDSWRLLAAAGASLPRVLLYGPPGTGKTYIATHAGIADPDRVYRVNMTEDTPAAELRGHYVPAGSEWVWQDGPAMTAFRHGGRLVVDEITRASDDALSFMLALLDGHKITLPDGTSVFPHPEFSVWATTNDTITALTDALADRFVIRVECKAVNPEALRLLPAALQEAVRTGPGNGGVTQREAMEFTRLLPVVGPSAAARLIWEKRGRDLLASLKLADIADEVPADGNGGH